MATLRRNQDDPKVGVLRAIPGFKDCTDSELATFARWLDECEVAKGEVLSTENRAGREMYILLEGLAEARRGGILLWECGPGDLLGEIRLGVAPATATITARTPLRLLALLPSAHAQLFELPGVARWVTRETTRRLRHVLDAPQGWPAPQANEKVQTGGAQRMGARMRSRNRRAALLGVVIAMIATAGAPAAPAKASAGQALRGGPPMTLLGHTPIDGMPGLADLAVHRRTAYVGTEDHSGSCPARGVHVVDLTNPEEPRPIGAVAAHPLTITEDVAIISAATPTFTGDLLAVGLQACDDHLDEAVGKSGLELFDVSDPRRPIPLSRIELGVPHLTGVHELALFQRGGRAYALLAVPFSEVVTSVFTPGQVRGDVRIVDVTDPRNPVEVGDWAAGRDAGLAFGAPFFAWFGLDAPFDCSPPSGGAALCRGDDFAAVFAHSVSVDASGTRAYVSHWDAGMVMLDITDPANPVLLGRADAGPDEEGNTHSAIPARGNRLAVTTDEDRTAGPWGFTRIWDVADPSNPVEVGRFATENALSGRTDGDYSVHNPVVHGSRLYLSHYSDGLRVVDISDPRSPREVANFLPPVESPHVHGVAVADGLVVITDSHGGLFVLRHGHRAGLVRTADGEAHF